MSLVGAPFLFDYEQETASRSRVIYSKWPSKPITRVCLAGSFQERKFLVGKARRRLQQECQPVPQLICVICWACQSTSNMAQNANRKIFEGERDVMTLYLLETETVKPAHIKNTSGTFESHVQNLTWSCEALHTRERFISCRVRLPEERAQRKKWI